MNCSFIYLSNTCSTLNGISTINRMKTVALNHDVLAIRCIDNYLIIGIGNQLHIYNNSTLNREFVLNTFHHDIIHGIVRCDDHLIIFGGRCLSIYQYETSNNAIRLKKSSSHSFNDWIIAAECFSSINHEKICILFAHNNLHLYNTSTKKSANVWCEEKCILYPLIYSGCISIEQSNQAVIFSGTVFQEILIWKVRQNSLYLIDVPVLWRLKGHKGVIFSIFYDPCKNLITSSSDDRTVRLWAIRNNYDEPLETNNWENIKINLTSTMYGHTSRVWKSIIVNDNIISIGEDSQICIWSLDGNLLNKITAHDGATVWSIEVSKDKSLLFTGGANGGVNSWPLFSNQIESSLHPKFTFEKTKLPKYVGYLRSGALLIFIDGGELIIHTPNDTNESMIKHSIDLPRYKYYCLMQISPYRSKVAFASKDGHVDIFERIKSKLEISKISQNVIESKIFSIHWLDEQTLLICGCEGHLKVLNITEDNKLITTYEFILPTSRERWTTAAVLLKNLLICGDRNGNIYIYLEHSQKNSQKYPIQTLSRVHGPLGVQSFAFIKNKLISTGRDGTLRFYKICDQSKDDFSKVLQRLHCRKMPMEWVSKILKTEDDIYVLGFKEMEFMIYSTNLQRLIIKFICGGGHRSWDCIFCNDFIHFVCIKNKQVYTLDNIPRIFSKTIVSGYHTKEIHCIKTLSLGINKNILISASEDCSLRITNLRINDKFNSNLDKISSNHHQEYQLSFLDTIDGHISSVKCLDVINLKNSKQESKNLVFSGGGRSQLKVWEVTINSKNEELSANDLDITELTSFMLRGTDKDRRRWFDKKEEYFVDPETRFMDINAFFNPFNDNNDNNSNNSVILIVACSDGYIRILIYKISTNNLHLSAVIPYYNRCIIKIHSFILQNQVILLSMATDGFINIWALNTTIKESFNEIDNDGIVVTSHLRPFKQWNAHQSGINSYDFKENKREFFLLSGGDDNKISLSLFTLSVDEDELSAEITAQWSSLSTHYAQITGVKFYKQNNFISVAIDQRIVTYNYTYNKSTLSITPLQKVTLTSVADVHGLALVNNIINYNINNTLACIYGRGIEVILLEDNHQDHQDHPR